MSWLSKLFSKKETKNAPVVLSEPVVPSEKPSEAAVEKNPYVFEAGEKTIYDCIVEAKELELDMRLINAKVNSMNPREFIAWFDEYKKNFEK